MSANQVGRIEMSIGSMLALLVGVVARPHMARKSSKKQQIPVIDIPNN
jgi:hypothetical protein